MKVLLAVADEIEERMQRLCVNAAPHWPINLISASRQASAVYVPPAATSCEYAPLKLSADS